MIAIKNRPYDGIYPKLNGAYNGLPFVLDSNAKQKPNFRYLCDIWVNGIKTARLKHNPDITADNFGIFDAGPILESYLSYDLKLLEPFSGIAADQSVKKYWVELGEEYARTNTIRSISNAGGDYSRVYTKYDHSIRKGDTVLIGGCENVAYNGWFRVRMDAAPGAQYFDIIKTYAGANGASGWLAEGEKVTAWGQTTISGQQYLTVTCLDKNSAKSRFNLGDTVQVSWHTFLNAYTDVPQNSYENTDWKIIRVSRYNTGLMSAIVKYTLDCPYKGAVAYEGGIASKDNYVFENQISTKLDGSYAWNGVLQYDEANQWAPQTYKFASVDSKFLSDSPNRSIKVCANEHWTLHCLGTALNAEGTKIRLTVATASGSAQYSLDLSTYATAIPCGPENLKAASIAEFVNATAISYTIWAVDALGNRVSEIWSFAIQCDCERLPTYKLFWLNQKGGFDYYKFPKRSDKRKDIEKSTFDKNLRSYSTNKYGYSYGDRGTTTYRTSSRETTIVRTGFLTQAELDWLSWIYESPEVYYIDESTGKIYPVTVMNTSVAEPNKLNRGDAGSLYIYEAELQMAAERTIQKGGIGVPAVAAGTIGAGGGQASWF